MAGALCLFIWAIAQADTIEVPLTGALSGFGSSQVYRGQTLTSPLVPVLANQLTVYVGPTADKGADFRVLLMEVDTTNGFHPTKVLFESATFNVPILPLKRDPDPFVIDLDGLRLEANREYAWILDHFVVAGASVVSMGTGTGPAYDGGFAFRFINGPFLPPGTRQQHFASDAWIINEWDFAFTLDITPVLDAGESDVVLRDVAAIMILITKYGPQFVPNSPTGLVYDDVNLDDFAAAWIEHLNLEAITEGCGGNNYCPKLVLTKEQLAKVLLRARYGGAFEPAPATGVVFDDVSKTDFAADWIEQLASEGMTEGCTLIRYCPKEAVTVSM